MIKMSEDTLADIWPLTARYPRYHLTWEDLYGTPNEWDWLTGPIIIAVQGTVTDRSTDNEHELG